MCTQEQPLGGGPASYGTQEVRTPGEGKAHTACAPEALKQGVARASQGQGCTPTKAARPPRTSSEKRANILKV